MDLRILRILLPIAVLTPLQALASADIQPLSGPSFMSISRGLLGILTIIGLAWLFSAKRKQVDWRVVGVGIGFQLILALCILYVPAVQLVFETVGKAFAVDARYENRISGKIVILVDDVHTSGATARACTRVLLKAGARSVHLLCWARVLENHNV